MFERQGVRDLLLSIFYEKSGPSFTLVRRLSRTIIVALLICSQLISSSHAGITPSSTSEEIIEHISTKLQRLSKLEPGQSSYVEGDILKELTSRLGKSKDDVTHYLVPIQEAFLKKQGIQLAQMSKAEQAAKLSSLGIGQLSQYKLAAKVASQAHETTVRCTRSGHTCGKVVTDAVSNIYGKGVDIISKTPSPETASKVANFAEGFGKVATTISIAQTVYTAKEKGVIAATGSYLTSMLTSKAVVGSFGMCSEVAASLAFVPWVSIGSGAVCSGLVLYHTSGISQHVADILSTTDYSQEAGNEYSEDEHIIISSDDTYDLE